MSKEAHMFLAWVEIQNKVSQRNDVPGGEPDGLVEREFPGLRAARDWAVRQAARPEATGSVVVFERRGPLMRVAWQSRVAAAGSRRIGAPLLQAC
jgi:hypothetical protein